MRPMITLQLGLRGGGVSGFLSPRGGGKGGCVPVCHCWGWVLVVRGGWGEGVGWGWSCCRLDFLVYGECLAEDRGLAAGSGGWKMIARQSFVTLKDRMAPNLCGRAMALGMGVVFAVILPVSSLGLL